MIRIVACLVLLTVISFGQDSKDLIPSYLKFTPDSVIQRETSVIDPRRPSQTASGRLNGVAYKFYYSDGSGRFEGSDGLGIDVTRGGMSVLDQSWSVACKKDAIDDSVHCSAIRGDLWIFKTKTRTIVSVLGTKEPGSKIAIRVDENPAFTAPEAVGWVETSEPILRQLLAGKKAVTRYTRWPEGTHADKEIGLYGLSAVMAYLDWAIQQIK